MIQRASSLLELASCNFIIILKGLVKPKPSTNGASWVSNATYFS